MLKPTDYRFMMQRALEEAKEGLSEGGIPVGAAIFDERGVLFGSGRNRRVQDGDPSAHGETDAFRKVGRQKSYKQLILVTTLAPCWYCSGLIKQFGFGKVIVGDSTNFKGGLHWLAEQGIEIVELNDSGCIRVMKEFIAVNPALWAEDIGVL